MARSRNIKPGFFTNEDMVELDFATRLLFAGLWTVADREGRLQDRPKKIKIDVFPADNLDIDVMLQSLATSGFIERYEVAGTNFVQITNWHKHQNPHHTEKDSLIPDRNGVLTVRKPEDSGDSRNKDGGNLADSGFRIPDSPIPDSSKGEPAAAAAIPAKPKADSRKTSLPEDFVVSERVVKWAAERGYGQLDQHLDAFKRKCLASGYKKVSWDDFFMEAIREDWAKLRGGSPRGVAPPPETAAADPDSQSAIEAEGVAKGIGRWNGTEQFSVYKARVRGKGRLGLDLDQLAAMAAKHQGAAA